MSQRDEDELWRSIVENYGERVTLDPSPEPPAEAAVPAPQPRHRADAPDLLDAYDDPDDHFVPPEAPRVTTPEPPRLLAWVGVLGVPVIAVLLSVVRVALPAWAALLCLAWFVGGFGYLVATMRRDDGPGDGDDGARL